MLLNDDSKFHLFYTLLSLLNFIIEESRSRQGYERISKILTVPVMFSIDLQDSEVSVKFYY